jgi:hypothetical protein
MSAYRGKADNICTTIGHRTDTLALWDRFPA